jgi:hypothetical protein
MPAPVSTASVSPDGEGLNPAMPPPVVICTFPEPLEFMTDTLPLLST